jgi:hypothetical protein
VKYAKIGSILPIIPPIGISQIHQSGKDLIFVRPFPGIRPILFVLDAALLIKRRPHRGSLIRAVK